MEQKLKLLSNNERQRILRFRKWEDRQRSLLANIAVRRRLEILLQEPINPSSIERDQKGRPFLKNFRNWQGDFNLSHSGEWIISGITTNGKIGVDVEQIQSIDLSVSELCFTQEEKAYLYSLPTKDQLSFFYEIWTLKEAFVKTIGQGLLFPINSVGFDMNKWTQNKITMSNTTLSFHHFLFQLYRLEPNYIVAVCTNLKHVSDLEIQILDRSDIL
ncbi:MULTISPECIES: 4'-phosphopantetheinyl transferase family protein [Bacillus]|uniref:4'-phosphopantetheinyl transferase family protein n=1 Tax=Bacillus TaxID=1386 RepID=UPI0010BE36E8|nr:MULTISPECIES: 4'-phosphopantetheinyl transferase superfamily protein [Bacillus]TKI09077.1 4'-phosphopantetheinyl transferase superfamily protein [Bacillus wiedmannii]